MKTLIISHNSFSTYHNMGKTFRSLFKTFSPQELCQFYIYPTVPDTDKCGSYFQITDKDVLRSYRSLRVGGREIVPDVKQHEMFSDPEDVALYRNRKNKSPIRMIGRDLMWKFSRWYTPEFQAWLEREKPDVIFLAPGPATFIYRIARRVAKDRKIPVVAYICDDYYFVKQPGTLLGRLHQRWLSGTMEETMKSASHIITICDALNVRYSAQFGVEATTIMTGADQSVSDGVLEQTAPKIITYMGNVRCNRYLSLAEIGRVLDEINAECGTSYALKIYSGEKSEEILSAFDGIGSIQFCGFVSGEAFDKAFRETEILLHTEAFDEASIDFVKHSVSTKIADSLASGRPLFAYGPAQVASMQHLIQNDCAITATTKAELKEKLLQLFSDAELRRGKTENARKTAAKYHDQKVNSQLLYQIMTEVVEKYENPTG